MTVRVLSPALQEITEAAIWLDSQAAGLGSEFWRMVDDSLKAIEYNPQRFARSEFATTEIDLRYLYVKRFKYVIHFAIEPTEVLIVAVTHAARKPGYWLRRVKPT